MVTSVDLFFLMAVEVMGRSVSSGNDEETVGFMGSVNPVVLYWQW